METQVVQEDGGLVFLAHPLLHGFPWIVADTVKNKHVVKAIKKQPFKQYKGMGVELTGVISKLRAKAELQEWIEAGLRQSPKELWAHKNELTDYQLWVAYRAATCQLNLYHVERSSDPSCRKTRECEGSKETLGHLFWECPSAKVCWSKLISHWTGEEHDQDSIASYLEYCASRKAPTLTKTRKMNLYVYEPDEEADMETMWKRIWRIACSICITSLWIQRNRVIFEQEEVSSVQAMQEYWSTCMGQLRALAKRERRSTNTTISGTLLQLGTQILQQKPRETPSKVETRE